MSRDLILLLCLSTLLAMPGCAGPAPLASAGSAARGVARVGTYNVENLFDDVDDPHKADDSAPSPDRLEALANVILAIDCDVLALQEVENLPLLEEFNRDFLDGLYIEVILVEGNDPRGIDVAVLSKLPITNVVSYRNREIPQPGGSSIRFSRDLLAVQWVGPGGRLWTLLTTHLKSGVEPESRARRTLQAEAVARICREDGYVSILGRGLVILAGDLNAEPWTDTIRALSSVPFSDPARDLPYRYTHVSGKVLDYVLLSPDVDARYIIGSVRVYREPPAREASDHFPVYLDLRF